MVRWDLVVMIINEQQKDIIQLLHPASYQQSLDTMIHTKKSPSKTLHENQTGVSCKSIFCWSNLASLTDDEWHEGMGDPDFSIKIILFKTADSFITKSLVHPKLLAASE